MDRNQTSLFGDNAEYEAFTEKFVPKKTTDDCYTPEDVYDAVASWACAEYGLDRGRFVRPFWPELDFEAFDYPAGCVVLDNPPFSLLSKIVRFYVARGIDFFLFAPALTLFTASECPVCYLATGADVVYENGAEVPTSFITNLDRCRLRTAPDLRAAVVEGSLRAKLLRGQGAVSLPKYVYPDEVITAAAMQRLSKYGADFRAMPEDTQYIRTMDAQREKGKSIFGGAFLLKKKSAAERQAAERQAAERQAAERQAAERQAAERLNRNVFELSARERAWVEERNLFDLEGSK